MSSLPTAARVVFRTSNSSGYVLCVNALFHLDADPRPEESRFVRQLVKVDLGRRYWLEFKVKVEAIRGESRDGGASLRLV